MLPPGWPAAARVGSRSRSGIALIWLSRSLARRRRRAWQLAVAVVVASAVAASREGARLRGGDDLAAAARGAASATARRFDAPGDPGACGRCSALGAGARRGRRGRGRRSSCAARELPDRLGDVLTARRASSSASRRSSSGCGPLAQAVAQTRRASGAVARALVEAYGSDSLSFFALRRDKSYFFSPTRRRLPRLPRRRRHGAVSGDPVGEESEFDALLAELQRASRARTAGGSPSSARRTRAPRVATGGSGCARSRWARRRCCSPETFSLEGRAIRKVRQSVSRLAEGRLPAARRRGRGGRRGARARSSRRCPSAWRGDQPRARLLDGDRRPLRRRGRVFAVARGRRRRASAGSSTSRPTPAGGGWSLEHDAPAAGRAERPHGVPDRRDTRLGDGGRRERALAQLLRASPTSSRRDARRRSLRRARAARAPARPTTSSSSSGCTRSTGSSSRSGGRATSASSGSATCRAVGLAYLHAESLLVPPGRGRRRAQSDRRADDLEPGAAAGSAA